LRAVAEFAKTGEERIVLLDMNGQRVRSLREQKGMSRGQLAEDSSVSEKPLQNAELFGQDSRIALEGPAR
jgi:ribosome-binding protein aMBF1 (putative translation factor)